MASKRKNHDKRNITAIPLDTKLSKTHRIAAVLDWWAAHHPGDFMTYNEVLQAIEGYGRLPRMDNDEVAGVRSKCSGAARILRETYGREKVAVTGVGVRATTDAADIIRHVQTKRVLRVETAIKGLAATHEIVDVTTVPDTAENKDLKAWYARGVKGLLKEITSAEFMKRLLPPSEEPGNGG